MNKARTQAAPAAFAPAHPTAAEFGYLINEDAYYSLQRAVVLADMLAGVFSTGFTENGAPLLMTSQQIGTLGEYLHQDLKTTLDACRWTGRTLADVRADLGVP